MSTLCAFAEAQTVILFLTTNNFYAGKLSVNKSIVATKNIINKTKVSLNIK